jgi:hypothetical protein
VRFLVLKLAQARQISNFISDAFSGATNLKTHVKTNLSFAIFS